MSNPTGINQYTKGGARIREARFGALIKKINKMSNLDIKNTQKPKYTLDEYRLLRDIAKKHKK